MLLLLGLFAVSMSVFGQEIKIGSYLKGDWYFLNAEHGDCGFDSVYYEIAFSDLTYSFINSCTRSEYVFNYRLKNNVITGYTLNDSIIMKGEIIVKDQQCFDMVFKESKLTFHRVIDTSYKYSELIHDNKEINKLELNLPSEISNSLWYHGYNYYSGCLRRRELWLRLERGEVEKKSVIRWANKMLNDCYGTYETSLYENYISMIDSKY